MGMKDLMKTHLQKSLCGPGLANVLFSPTSRFQPINVFSPKENISLNYSQIEWIHTHYLLLLLIYTSEMLEAIYSPF